MDSITRNFCLFVISLSPPSIIILFLILRRHYCIVVSISSSLSTDLPILKLVLEVNKAYPSKNACDDQILNFYVCLYTSDLPLHLFLFLINFIRYTTNKISTFFI